MLLIDTITARPTIVFCVRALSYVVPVIQTHRKASIIFQLLPILIVNLPIAGFLMINVNETSDHLDQVIMKQVTICCEHTENGYKL